MLQTLWDYAFYGCFGLTSITIPNSVESIGEVILFMVCYKFSNNNNSRIVLQGIWNLCFFQGCLQVKSVTIPNSITTIGNSTPF